MCLLPVVPLNPLKFVKASIALEVKRTEQLCNVIKLEKNR